MTTLLILAIIVSAIFAVAHATLGQARTRAAGQVAEGILRDLDLYMTLTGHLRKVKGAPIWGKLLSTQQMAYKVVAHAGTGKVTVHCTQLTAKGNPGRECSLTLDGSCFKLTDTLAMQAQARAFVADCAREYLAPAVDRKSAQDAFSGLLDKLANLRK